MNVANFITEKTSLEYNTSFSVFKLHQRRFSRIKPTFVSFKIKAKDKDVFDVIMAPDLWGPEYKASPYDRSVSKTKAMERRSKCTSSKLEAPQSKPQSKANTAFNHIKRGNQLQNEHQPYQDKPQLKKPQNRQYQKQQQYPNRQKKQQQQQQLPQRHQKKQQHQQRRGKQPNNGHFFHQNPNSAGKHYFNGTPGSNHVNSQQGANFQPYSRKIHAPPNNLNDQLLNVLQRLQQLLAQRPQF